ncbi:MAG: acetate kinase [Candidatus Bathyarchaeia archaeon]
MKVLTLNCGSSSVKYMLYNWDEKAIMAKGIVERVTIGGTYCIHEAIGRSKIRIDCDCLNHAAAVKLILDTLTHSNYGVINDLSEVNAVGHRVVHGGENFSESVIIDDTVLQTIKNLASLAPLHNPYNILGIEVTKKFLPNIPHIAIFDTAWHQTLQPPQYLYATPYDWYKKYRIRRYGFHGTSFLYVSRRAAVLLDKEPSKCDLIILHIGNGASANAVKNGVSFDTSMGFTPLEGLVMGTRAGDHDVAIDLYIMEKENYSTKEIYNVLNKKSGLLGITGKYIDRRDIMEAIKKGDKQAKLALEIEAYRIKKYIGAYMAALGGADAIVWTAGAGEMFDTLRAKAMDGLEFMGIKYDPNKNKLARSQNAEFDISASDSKLKIFVIPTDEEQVFVEEVIKAIDGRYHKHTKFKYSFEERNYRNKIRDREFIRELEEEPRKAIALAQPFPDELLPDKAKPYAWWLKKLI